MLQATERKRAILATSQQLFREKGYVSTSVRDIAKALDIEPASLYSHINTKEDILKITCFEMAEQFEKAIQEVNDIYFNADERLKMAIQLHVEILTANVDAAVVFIRDWRNLSPESKEEFIQMRNRYEEGIRKIIQDGIDEGNFEPIDVKIAALTILSSVNWIVEWYRDEGRLGPKEIAEKLSGFVLSGLKSGRPTQEF
jgi:AcrR family transcriptional regulator